MPQVTEVLQWWGDLGIEKAAELNLNGQANDKDAIRQAIWELDKAAAPYLGVANFVMQGAEVTLLDEENHVLYDDRALVHGTFHGAEDFVEDGLLHFGYSLMTDYENVVVLEDVEEEVISGVTTAIGPIATTKLWSPDDVFSGCRDIDLARYEAEPTILGRLERIIDNAVDGDELRVSPLAELFAKKGLITRGMMLDYMINRLNNVVRLSDYLVVMATRQVFVYRPGDLLKPLLPGIEAVRWQLPYDAQFTAHTDAITKELKLGIKAPLRNKDGFTINFIVVYLRDVDRAVLRDPACPKRASK